MLLKNRAATVIELAKQAGELKGRAESLRDSTSPRLRGFFTPSEDEATRRILVSYSNVRAALLEILSGLRAGGKGARELAPGNFLVGYATALVLVDLARTLRESFGNVKTVRDKLNEAEPHFGIRPGFYDEVQLSLTEPRNVAELRRALARFDTERAALEMLAHEEGLEAILELAASLTHRIEVSLLDIAGARVVERVRQGMHAIARDGIAAIFYDIQETVSRMVSSLSLKPDHQHRLPASVESRLEEMLAPGDILLTRKDFVLTNYFLPGVWPHAALVLGRHDQLAAVGLKQHENFIPRWQRLLEVDHARPGRVLEALADGVRLRSLASPFACDSIVLMRPRISQSGINFALGRGMFHEGKPYDFDFDFTRSDRMVCTEVVYRAYEGVEGIDFPLRRRAGRLNFSAADLLELGLHKRGFDVLAVLPPGESELIEGERTKTRLRELVADLAPAGEDS